MKTLTAYIMDDTVAEDNEVMFLYLTPITEGVRVATPSRDADKLVITSSLHIYFLTLHLSPTFMWGRCMTIVVYASM